MSKFADNAHHYAYAVAIVIGLGLLGYFFSLHREPEVVKVEAQPVATSSSPAAVEATASAGVEKIEGIPRDENIARATITPTTASFPELVSMWQNRVAEVTCTFSDGSESGGAATLINLVGYGLTAVTNDHVISDDNDYGPLVCLVGIYGLGGRVISADPDYGHFYGFRASRGLDLGYITLSNPYSSSDNGLFDAVSNTQIPVCVDANVALGDEILILGYPWNGSSSSVTASRGVIAGFDNAYYVTDAKIEHGNSGGAAILKKDNCWLGIPTGAVVGTIESYGRILKGSYVLE
ncbi:MAG TPA: serine protease [Candidatus Paceibacterota bacterium]